MIPMMMIGKNFKGSRDKIWAATASASANQEGEGFQVMWLLALHLFSTENTPVQRELSSLEKGYVL
jgi:hypothetical protein